VTKRIHKIHNYYMYGLKCGCHISRVVWLDALLLGNKYLSSSVIIIESISGKSWRSNNDDDDVMIMMVMMIIIIVILLLL
jgi:hypothetical protein